MTVNGMIEDEGFKMSREVCTQFRLLSVLDFEE